MKVLDMCVVDEKDRVYEATEEDMVGEWDDYIDSINCGNLDEIYLTPEEVDKEVFILLDGGEVIHLKDGAYLNLCWRGCTARAWFEEDEDTLNYYNTHLTVC